MFHGRQSCRCIFIYTMAPGTHGTGTRTSPVHLSPKPLPPVRDNQQGVLQWTRESPQTRGHRPAFLTAVLVISTRVTHKPLTQEEQPASFETSLPAELLQLLNLPVVPQLGGEGASLGPTRQPCARTWELYLSSYYYISVSLSLSS